MSAKRVCIVGGGACGLVSIKNCLEAGLEPFCFEKSSDIGGLWNYRDESGKEHMATVMESTVVNSCKEMYAFSDFPPPRQWPNFTRHSLVIQYLRMYAEKFGLLKYIRFNTAVGKIEKADAYEITGQWTVRFKDGTVDVFDFVMLCTGHHAETYVPHFEGLDRFQGQVLHSQKYKNWKEFKNRKVLIVGIGNSALDISTELSDHCRKVYLSTRRGVWIWPRVWKKGFPVDAWYLSKWKELVFGTLIPLYYINGHFEHTLNKRFDAVRFGMKPKHRFWSQHPAVNDRIHACIGNGTVVMKQNVQHFTETSAVFTDGTEAEIDVVILCTGYIFGFPFLDPDVVPVHENQVRLYKYVFPPHLPHPTLAVIGLIQPHGPLFPLAELQGRWATSIFANKTSLPSRNVMEKDIDAKIEFLRTRYFQSQKHTLQIMVVPYADEISELIGAKPNIMKLLFTDPKLAVVTYFGPYSAYVFRLNDPKTHDEARTNIMGAVDRIIAPTQSRKPVKTWPHYIMTPLTPFVKVTLFIILALIFTKLYLMTGLQHSTNLILMAFVYFFFCLSYFVSNLFICLLVDPLLDYWPIIC